MTKKVDKDPFSNGSEYAYWDDRNCQRCVKASRYTGRENCDGTDEYTRCRCAIQRDIFTRMCGSEPISQRTIDACKHYDCPYRQEHYKKYPRHKNEPTIPNLFE